MQTNNLPLVTAIMCTYGRFSFVERAVNCFLQQTYPNKRLIIYNTACEDKNQLYDTMQETHFENLVPAGKTLTIINNNIDHKTGEPYTNVGAIRRDALSYACDEGYHVTWDDDDIFLPWFMQQAIDRMQQTGLPSFKPQKSFFYSGHLRLCQNTLEASVVADMKKVREYGFLLETGKEGLGWYTKMRDNKELDENDTYYIPSYCFDWNSGTDVHRQSGDIDNPNNFNNHKDRSNDHVNRRWIKKYSQNQIHKMYKPYYDYLRENQSNFPEELYRKYI